MRSALVILVFTLSACGYDSTHLKLGEQGGGNSGTASGDVQALDYLTVNRIVFVPFCLRCHSNTADNFTGVKLDTYANVLKDLSVAVSAVNNGGMPMRGTISEEAKAVLNSWARAGAPEFAFSVERGGSEAIKALTLPPAEIPCDDGRDDRRSQDLIPLSSNYVFNKGNQTIYRHGSDCDNHHETGRDQ